MKNKTEKLAETEALNIANVSRSKKLYLVWDDPNCQLEEFDTLDECKKYIKENFDDEREGIHPDIESVFIMKRIVDVDVEVIKPMHEGTWGAGTENEYHRIIFKECEG